MMSLLNIYATSPRSALFANSAIFLSGTIRQKKPVRLFFRTPCVDFLYFTIEMFVLHVFLYISYTLFKILKNNIFFYFIIPLVQKGIAL